MYHRWAFWRRLPCTPCGGGGGSCLVLYIPLSAPQPRTSCLTFPIRRGFTVSVGAIARQWVRGAAICQCLGASGGERRRLRQISRKGDGVPEERDGVGGGEKRGCLICTPCLIVQQADGWRRGDTGEQWRWRYTKTSSLKYGSAWMCGKKGNTVAVCLCRATIHSSFFLSLSISGFLTQRLLCAPFISSIHVSLYLPHPLMFDRWHCFPASPSPLLLFNGRAVEVPCCCGTVGAIYSRG